MLSLRLVSTFLYSLDETFPQQLRCRREFLQFALESYSLVILCDNMSVWQSRLSEKRPPPPQHLQKIERHNVELALAAADNVCIFSENVAGKKPRRDSENRPVQRELNRIILNGGQNEEISLGSGAVQPLGSEAEAEFAAAERRAPVVSRFTNINPGRFLARCVTR